MSNNKTAFVFLLSSILIAISGCNETKPQITKSTPVQKEIVKELASGTLFQPGFRWTFTGTDGRRMYLESQHGKKIGDVETTRLRTKGDSLFWTHELYVQCADGELLQIASAYQDSMFIENPPPILAQDSLTKGQKWHCKSESDDGSSSTEFSVEVIRQESITVPSGTFDVWMVEYTLGFHFGTEHDLRIWFNDEIGIVKIEKWRLSTLGKKENMRRPIVYGLAHVERLADAHRIDYPSELIEIENLPKNVVAPDGQVTLYADFDDVWQNQIVLYLVNRTDEDINVPAQDDDLYVKLEARTNAGDWVRAQTHQNSWCGNSYHSLVLKPNTFVSLLGFQPSKGRKQLARYRCYSSLEIESNVGEIVIDDQLISAAKKDDLSRPDNQP